MRAAWARLGLVCFVLGAVSPTAGFAQSVAPGTYDGQPITALELVGPAAPSPDVFVEATGLRVGKPYSGAAIRHMIEALHRLDQYTDIRVDAEPREAGVALTVWFVSKVRLKAVDLRGHQQSTTRLRDVVGLRLGDELTESAVRGAVDRLKMWYFRLGYLVDITPSIHLEDEGTRARLTMTIAEHDRVRIQEITFPGSLAFSRLRHLIALRTATGEYFSHDHLDRGLARLVELYHDHGYPKAVIGPPTIELDPRSVTISLPIERGPRYRVVVEGRPGVRQGTLIDQLTVFQEQRDDEVFLTDEAERLTRFLSDRGFRHASVHIRREVESADRIVLHIVVDAGARFRLEEVALDGHQAVSTRELNALIATVPSSWFRTRYAKQDMLDTDRERIDAWYRGRGFLTPQVVAEIAEDPARRTARVTFRITEGPQTLIGAVRTEGHRAFNSEALLQHANLQPGSPYIESAARTARAALLAFYNEHGYLYATIEATPRFSDDRTRVDLTLVIDEGLHVTIGTITLSGNQRTEDRVIRRELQVKTGDAYNPRLVLESQRRVARLGFLSEVRLEPVNPEQPESVKALRLSVKERDAGSVDLGVGYANFEGIRGFTEIAYRNLGGTGRRIALRADGSRLERRTVLSYLEPWVLGRRLDGRAALLNELRIEENKGYERTTYGVSLALEKELSPTLRASLGYDYQRHQFIGLDGLPLTDFLNLATPEDLRRANIGAVTPTVIRDTRDDPFNPSSGSTQTIAVRDAARILASENQFWKVTVASGWYRALGRSLVGAVALRTGVANRFGETSALPLPERFYLGGRNTVRGYDEDTLGPTDPVKGTPTGGNAMIVGNIELRIRLPRALGLVFFVDGGNVWQEFHDVRLSEVRTTVGSGIRYNTPVGPLRLDYGHKVNWQPGENHGTFHFTLGHAF